MKRIKKSTKFNHVENKISFSIIIAITSLMIALLSLSFSIYKFNIEQTQQQDAFETLQRNTQFEQTQQKITLIEENLQNQELNCKSAINDEQHTINLQLLNNARTMLINNNERGALNALQNVKPICAEYEEEILFKDDTVLIEVFILVTTWVVLLITLVFVLLKQKKN